MHQTQVEKEKGRIHKTQAMEGKTLQRRIQETQVMEDSLGQPMQ